MKTIIFCLFVAAGDATTVETDTVPTQPLEPGMHLRAGRIVFEAPNISLGGKAYTAQRVTIRHGGGVLVIQPDNVRYPVDPQGQEFCRAIFNRVPAVGPAEVVFEAYMGGRLAKTHRILLIVEGGGDQ